MSRRIPISSRGDSSDGPPISHHNSTTRPVSSSLDIVFSYVRAQSFYENQLPSFTDRFLNQEGIDSDALETSSSRDGTTDFSGEEDNPDLSRDQSGIWDEETLPRNAIQETSNFKRRPSLATVQSPPSSILQDENTPLINLDGLRAPTSSKSFERRSKLAFSGSSSSSIPKHDPHHPTSKAASFMARRLSIISSVGEAYLENIEENRGNSSYNATLFNMTNVLIGVGLLGLPLSFADSGWISGVSLLIFCALVTNYTAKLLTKMMSKDGSLETYAEILIAAFGPRARMFIYFAFALELGSLSIALVVLFGDTMSELFPSISSNAFKVIGYFIILPTQFLPIRFLSFTSLIGIASSFLLLAVLLIDGSIKPDLPGSLHQIMPTSLGPDLGRLPLSFGIIMSGFSGHAVVPSIYIDLKNKKEFSRAVDVAYVITFIVSLVMGSAGYLMFGKGVSNEITKDLIRTGPPILNRFAMYAIAISPIVKYALASKPLLATLENLLGLRVSVADAHEHSAIDDSFVTPPPETFWFSHYLHLSLKPLTTAFIVFLSIVIPSFDVVLSFLGSCSAFCICAIFPLSAYLIMGGDEVDDSRATGSVKLGRRRKEPIILRIPLWEKIMIWILLVICTIMAVTGTARSFTPDDWII